MKTNRGLKTLKPTFEQIAIAAYHLYLERGGRHGHDMDDWLHAEQLLSKRIAEEARINTPAAAAPAPPSSQTVAESEVRSTASARPERRSTTRGETRKQTTTPLRPAASA